MAYHKGQLNDSDICGHLERLLKQNIITLKELHSLIGKLGHCASLLIVMRPFLEPLWAALYDYKPSSAPRHTIWAKQISSQLKWFRAFFTEPGKPVERFYRLDAYLRTGTIVEIGTDASPYGMGGVDHGRWCDQALFRLPHHRRGRRYV